LLDVAPCTYQIESLVQLEVNVLVEAQILHIGVNAIRVVIDLGGRRNGKESPGEITPADCEVNF